MTNIKRPIFQNAFDGADMVSTGLQRGVYATRQLTDVNGKMQLNANDETFEELRLAA